jgi:hypothetical protein
MSTNDPRVQQAVDFTHIALANLLARLDALEQSGVLSPIAADATRGWRERAASALNMFRVHVMHQGETFVESEMPVVPAEEESAELPAEEAPEPAPAEDAASVEESSEESASESESMPAESAE